MRLRLMVRTELTAVLLIIAIRLAIRRPQLIPSRHPLSQHVAGRDVRQSKRVFQQLGLRALAGACQVVPAVGRQALLSNWSRNNAAEEPEPGQNPLASK